MADGTPQPEAMNPLGRLVKAAMDERGMSTREVEAAGGPPASTTGRIINPRVTWKRPPSDATLGALAEVLKIPVVRMQQAVAETMAWDITNPLDNPHIRDVAAAMVGVPEPQQAVLAKVVLLLAHELRETAEPTFDEVRGAVRIDIHRQDTTPAELPRAARKKTRPTTRELLDQQDDPS